MERNAGLSSLKSGLNAHRRSGTMLQMSVFHQSVQQAPNHSSTGYVPFITTMEISQAHFRFLDLPKEVRLIIYDHLPRHIRRQEMCIRDDDNDGRPVQKLTVVLRTMSLSILSTCRQIQEEASPLVQRVARDFILLDPPRLIFEAQMYFNGLCFSGSWMPSASKLIVERSTIFAIRLTVPAQLGDMYFHDA